ncbi:uncharacterized protein LOC114526666 [Dendronephthya gigantea]|uniref:uncharacterized protein LOC114526666 n=1 Tax=Dendronephthya gigantea TaxID=151771 RepID=UPI00106D0C23|nr:uncharacterized protein LOC114526666 [Dendronephthya gigantea]
MDENQQQPPSKVGSPTRDNQTTIEGERLNIDDTLVEINKNMSTMASILAKIHTQGESTGQNNSNKPPREDELSLYAADSADDLAKLTASMQPQGAGDDGGGNADGVSQILDDLAKSFGDDTGEKSPDIQPKLAEIITKRWGKKLTPEKLKGLLDKYNSPGNCPSLICQKVNPQIWNTLSQGTKKYDVHLYNLQETIIKAVFASLQTTSTLVLSDLGTDHAQLMGQSIDSLAMLAHAHAQLTQLRKNQIRPSLKAEYSAICSLDENQESKFLFGDDLPKVLKEAKESNYLDYSCKVFKAGQVAKHMDAWVGITNDKEILKNVQGVEIDLIELPSQTKAPVSKFQPHEFHLVDEAVTKLVKKDAVREVTPSKGQYVSKIFLRPKTDGTHRLILNLKQFNESVVYTHFKMDSIQTIIRLVEKDCYMATLDLKDAYYSIPVKRNDQKFLQFEWKGIKYQFTCLPNGLSSAPRTFTKILKPVLATLHKMGHISTVHIDDCYLQGKTYDQCIVNVIDSVILFDSLGFVVHPTKSVLTPSQEIVTLGFLINSVEMTIRLTRDKALDLKQECQTLLKSEKSKPIREVAKVIGKIVASFPGVMYGPLYYRYLERDKSQALKSEKGNFDAHMVFSPKAKSELNWWVANVTTAYQRLEREAPQSTIYTDASLSGWGAEFQGNATGGNWTEAESKMHINYLEMLAIYLGLKTFLSKKVRLHIRIMCDNTSAVSILNHMGTSHSDPCNELTKLIWEWCIHRKIWISTVHIPGKNNIVADIESRRDKKESEWMLNKASLSDALENLRAAPNIDLFASRINKQFNRYVSYRPDPDAECDTGNANKNSKGQGRGNSSNTRLADPMLVREGLQTNEAKTRPLEEKQNLTNITIPPQRDPPNMAETKSNGVSIIRESLDRYELSKTAKDILEASWRLGTSRQYQTYLSKWQEYCKERRLDRFAPGIENTVEFLVSLYTSGLGYSAINTALSTILMLENGIKFGEHPLVCRYMKGIFQLRPALPKYTQIWDVNVVLTYLKTFAETTSLSIKDLTIKLNILLFLTTGQRGQTIHLINVNYIQELPNGYRITIQEKLKQTKPGKHLKPLELLNFPEEPKLSVTLHLKEYLKKTSSYRGGHTQLLLSYVKPFKQVTKETLSRWVKKVLSSAGIDMDSYSPHSTRAASTSKCRVKGLQLDEIMKTAGWTNAGTFARFYNKPIESKTINFSKSLLQM